MHSGTSKWPEPNSTKTASHTNLVAPKTTHICTSVTKSSTRKSPNFRQKPVHLVHVGKNATCSHCVKVVA